VRSASLVLLLALPAAHWLSVRSNRKSYSIGILERTSVTVNAVTSMASARGYGNVDINRSVGGLLPAVPARFFAKLRSDKRQTKHPGSRFRASLLPSIRRIFGDRTCVTCRQIERSQAQGLRRPCPLFADRAQGDNRTGLGRTWLRPGIVDSGREIGHGNIDANDPERIPPGPFQYLHLSRYDAIS
jgi:hypothetical protein